MKSDQVVSPFYKYVTILILIPSFLLLAYTVLVQKNENMGDAGSLIMFFLIIAIPIFVVLLPKQARGVIKVLTPFGKTIDRFSDKIEARIDSLFVGFGKAIWFTIRYIIYPVVYVWLIFKAVGFILRFLIRF